MQVVSVASSVVVGLIGYVTGRQSLQDAAFNSLIEVRDSRARIAFVSTNSITQGEQVAQLWPLLFQKYRLELAFAHRTFAWGSDARGKAHVHVVIIGLIKRNDTPGEKRLFSYPNIKGDPVETRHAALTAYLFDAKGVARVRLHADWGGAMSATLVGERCQLVDYVLDADKQVFTPAWKSCKR